jgi:NADPH-dependent curcumin reductase CurA
LGLGLNYKSPSFAKDLEKATGASANVYFDNVGGEILNQMLPLMAAHGRIAVCGAISSYNGQDALSLPNWFYVIFSRIRIEGFTVADYRSKAGEVRKILAQAVEDGKLQIDEGSHTVVKAAFEDIPRVWVRLFEGANKGKLITAL